MEVGLYFQKINIYLNNIIVFPDASTNKVVAEISDFWNKEKLFEDFNITFRRGILLSGAPGFGKSTTLQLVSKDVINRGGIVLKFTSPDVFILGLRKIRTIQPDTPIVVLMEDLDAIINNFNESTIINILDGVDKLHKIVFLATTNFPERLEDRVLNRPSRFDKIHKIGFLSAESREIYFQYLIGDKDVKIDMNQWVSDTENLSIAHLKELFVSVVIFEDDYKESLERLKSMKIRQSSEDDRDRMGFR
jgi:SpoVK/Ycf46/Vps4 family AAA+-type ATPase